jgi:hypothetical protein
MPEEEILRYLRDGNVGMFPDELFSEAPSDVMGGFNKFGQLDISKDTKLVSCLKTSLQMEINFGQFHMNNDLMSLRL